MEKDKKKDSQPAGCSLLAILPAVITGLAGVIGAYLSYSAGVDAVRIPLRATQTAEARFGTSPPPTSAPANPPAPAAPIAVLSAQPWQPTGVYVNAGDTVNVSVTGGQWTTRREPLPDELVAELPDPRSYDLAQIWVHWQRESDGSGSATLLCESQACPIPNFYRGVLVGRIGNTVTSLGNSCSFTAQESGQLFLQVNDDGLDNNAGALAVSIGLNQFDAVPRSQKCGVTYP